MREKGAHTAYGESTSADYNGAMCWQDPNLYHDRKEDGVTRSDLIDIVRVDERYGHADHGSDCR